MVVSENRERRFWDCREAANFHKTGVSFWRDKKRFSLLSGQSAIEEKRINFLFGRRKNFCSLCTRFDEFLPLLFYHRPNSINVKKIIWFIDLPEKHVQKRRCSRINHPPGKGMSDKSSDWSQSAGWWQVNHDIFIFFGFKIYQPVAEWNVPLLLQLVFLFFREWRRFLQDVQVLCVYFILRSSQTSKGTANSPRCDAETTVFCMTRSDWNITLNNRFIYRLIK